MTDALSSPTLAILVRRVRALLAVGAVVAMPVALGSCAKSPTVILIEISVDDTVPPVLQLGTSVAQDPDPSQAATNLFGSLFKGDATDRPAPYVFPMLLPINVPPGWTGGARVTIEGRDWDTHAVNATGTTSVEIIPEHQIQATVTLTGVGGDGDAHGGTDGGTGGDDGGDGDDAGDDSSHDTVDDIAADEDAATD